MNNNTLHTVTVPGKDPYYFAEDSTQMRRFVHDLKVRGIPYQATLCALPMYDGISPLAAQLLPYTKMDVSFYGPEGERKLFSGTFENDEDVMQTIKKLIGKKTENYREHCDMTQPVDPDVAKYQAVLHAQNLQITLTPTRPIEHPLKGKEAVDLVAAEILSAEPRIAPIYGKPSWNSIGFDAWTQYELEAKRMNSQYSITPKEFWIVTCDNQYHQKEEIGFSTEAAAETFAAFADNRGLNPDIRADYIYGNHIDPDIYETMIPGWKFNEKKLFIVPENDAEAVEINKLLEQCPNAEVLVTKQTWGASWEGLEPEIADAVRQAAAEDREVYGVELQGNGPEGCSNIDHHKYQDDDRSNPLSSIEQVARVMSIELTRRQMLIAANDKGYIPAMEAMNATPEEIADIRKEDRLAQGITPEQDAQAQDVVDKLNVTGHNTLIVCNLPHSKCATVTDRLYGKYDNLLILCGDGESDFYGTPQAVNALHEKFGGWTGTGFWGSGDAPQKDVKKAVRELFHEKEHRPGDLEYGKKVLESLGHKTFARSETAPDKAHDIEER